MDKWFCGTAVASMDRGGFLKIQIWKKKLMFGDLMEETSQQREQLKQDPETRAPFI